MKPMRGEGFAAVCDKAVDAGIMASNNGSPTATPAPRRNVRRERCFFVMNMVAPNFISVGPTNRPTGGTPASLHAAPYRACASRRASLQGDRLVPSRLRQFDSDNTVLIWNGAL